MIRRIAIAILVLFTASASIAQPVAVRSGEHGAFTRLVLDVPSRQEWEVSQDGSRVFVRLPNLKSSFDVSEIYRRIRRDRIGSVTNGSMLGQLQIDLACECNVLIFRVSDRMIAIDVAPSDPALKDAPKKTQNQAEQATAETTAQRLSFGLSERIITPRKLPPILPGLSTKEEVEVVPATANDPMMPTILPQEISPDLLRQIGRAASQGLLTQRRSLPKAAPVLSLQVAATETSTPLPTQKTLDGELAPNVNLRAITSIDSGATDLLRAAISDPSDPQCIPDSALNVRDWVEEGEIFATVIGRLRADLNGEFDRINEQAALSLAKAYIYFGFGVEAGQVLTLVKGDTSTLKAMAAIIDDLGSAQARKFVGMEPCRTASALWAALGPDALPPGAALNTQHVQKSFDALPQTLRSYLGPKLARSLLAAGFSELSHTIVRRTERGVEEPDEHLKMADAALKLDAGQTEEGLEILAEVASEDGDQSPEALIRLVRQKFETGGSVSEDLANQIMVLAQENRSSDRYSNLKRAEIIARALAADFDSAFSELISVQENLEPKFWQKTYRDVFSIVTSDGSETDILTRGLLVPEIIKATLDPATSNAVAQQLLQSGLPVEAESFLSPGAAGELGRERRVLRAKIALATKRPRRAEADLLGLDGKDINRLRAEARFMAGDYAAATDLYLELGDDEMAAKSAWQAGQWEVVMEGPVPEFSSAADLAARQIAETTGPSNGIDQEVLARNRALIEGSTNSRQVLGDLLARAQVLSAIPSPAE